MVVSFLLDFLLVDCSGQDPFRGPAMQGTGVLGPAILQKVTQSGAGNSIPILTVDFVDHAGIKIAGQHFHVPDPARSKAKVSPNPDLSGAQAGQFVNECLWRASRIGFVETGDDDVVDPEM
jgi:hypothetical protein